MSLLIAEIILVAMFDLIAVTRLLRVVERAELTLPRVPVHTILQSSASLRLVE